MANWDKLNEEFDAILNNISDEEWNDWYNNIEAQKDMYKMQMLLESKMQSEKIIFNKLLGNLIIHETLKSNEIVSYTNIMVTKKISQSKSSDSRNEIDFPLAA